MKTCGHVTKACDRAMRAYSLAQVIMEREVNNPKYRFMFDHSSAEHLYYRWKVSSVEHARQLRMRGLDAASQTHMHVALPAMHCEHQ